MKVTGRKISWGVAVVVATLFMLIVSWITEMRYYEVDDAPTVRLFLGYEGGTPGYFHLIFHTLLCRGLYVLSTLFPGIAWVTVVQLFGLWIANVVIVKCLLEGIRRNQGGLWSGLALSAAYLGVFSFYFCSRPTFTTTAAMLSAAAVAQVMGIDPGQDTAGQCLRSMLLSFALLVFCYLLRQVTVVPCFAFWLFGLLWLGWKHALFASRTKAASFARAVAVCVIALVALMGVQAAEIKGMGMEDYVRWQEKRAYLFDYTDFATSPNLDTLEKTGWTEAEIRLIQKWYFLDENITAEAFEAQASMQNPLRAAGDTFWDRLVMSMKHMKRFWTDSPEWLFSFLALLALVCFSFSAALIGRKKKRRPWLALPGGVALGGVLLLFLNWVGRMILRAYANVLLPMSAFTILGALTMIGEREKGRKALSQSLAVLMAVVSIPLATTHYQSLTAPGALRGYRHQLVVGADLEAFARENPEKLIIYDVLAFRDLRLFPDTSQGIPINLMSWGDWECRTPTWYKQLEKFGLDGRHFTAIDLLKEQVVVLGDADGPPPELTGYVAERAGPGVVAEPYGRKGLCYFYQYAATISKERVR